MTAPFASRFGRPLLLSPSDWRVAPAPKAFSFPCPPTPTRRERAMSKWWSRRRARGRSCPHFCSAAAGRRRRPSPTWSSRSRRTPNRKIGEVQWPQQPPGNPATDFVTLKSEIITKDQAKGSLARLLGHSHEKEAFVFVHGFNNRFEDAVYRFAQILHDSGAGRGRRADPVHLAVGGQCVRLQLRPRQRQLFARRSRKAAALSAGRSRRSKPSPSSPIRWAIG